MQAEKQQVHLQYQQQMEQQVSDRVDLFPANQCDVDSIGGLNRQQKEWEKQKESELKRWRDEQEKESRQWQQQKELEMTKLRDAIEVHACLVHRQLAIPACQCVGGAFRRSKRFRPQKREAPSESESLKM